MSRPNNYRGRYNIPISSNNLQDDDTDLPEFEPFEDELEATPRAPFHDQVTLSVISVHMCVDINQKNHITSAYMNPNLVIRRGQEFFVCVDFSRPLTPDDSFQLEFLIGANPSAGQGTMVSVMFGAEVGGAWVGRIAETNGSSLMLGITSTPDAIIGKFRTYVTILGPGGKYRTKRDSTTDFYMLFNAWNPEDAVFLPDEAGRAEYVLNDTGVIFQGEAHAVSQRHWVYGQFEKGILDACIYILDASHTPLSNRGNVMSLVRKGSAMINSQDDNGILVGNWSEDFSMGTPPTAWTGSVKILLQYASSGTPVSYAQCWVFAGVFNTFLRCLGIPSRVITNFSSAHDNTGNLKTDLIFKQDGTPDRRNTRDSIWNYHCWNEVFMTRPDLPQGLAGWQVVDATPQETSDGLFRCGPTSVAAIKEGLLCHPFDASFVFAEVNSDVVFQKIDKYGNLTPYRVEKSMIGQAILTKAVGSGSPNDITGTYKYPEGSAQDAQTMERAEQYGCVRDHSELDMEEISVVIQADQVSLGQDFNLVVVFLNQGSVTRTIQSHLSGSVVFYTGVVEKIFKHHNFSVSVAPQTHEKVVIPVLAEEYVPHLGSQLSLHFMVFGKADDQLVTAMKVVTLQPPALELLVTGVPQRYREMFVMMTFTNPFTYYLEGVYVSIEGAGLMDQKTRYYNLIAPGATITWKESFYPRLSGPRTLIAILDAKNLTQTQGLVELHIQL